MAALIPLLTHLSPPMGGGPCRLDRFSPYYTHAAEYGLKNVRPAPGYYYVFPFGKRELERLAYFFQFDYPYSKPPLEYGQAMAHEVRSDSHGARGAHPR